MVALLALAAALLCDSTGARTPSSADPSTESIRPRFGQDRSLRIALIGDSHSQALWPRLRRDLEVEGHRIVLQEANPGWSEATYLAKGGIDAKIRAARPDLVVFELGGNNQAMSAENYQRDVAGLVALAQNVGASVVWFGPPTSNAARAPDTARRHEVTATLQGALLAPMGVAWVDSRPVTREGHRDDGVHFHAAGYDAWARTMAPRIAEAMRTFQRQADASVRVDR